MGFFDRFRSHSTPTPTPDPAAAAPPYVQLPLRLEGNDLADSMGAVGLQLTAGIQGNAVCSAFSIFEAWLRVCAGAVGPCRAELDRALGVTGDNVALRAALTRLTNAVDAATGPECTVRIANAIWVHPQLSLQPEFEAEWGGATRELDLSQARTAADTINAWVEQHTDGLIREIVLEENLHAFLAMVLANAIYLKAKWSGPFDGNLSSDREFELVDGQRIAVPTMRHRGSYACVAADAFELLSKPYVSGNIEFVVVLPRPGRFEEVRDGLSFATVRRALAASERLDTMLQLPKFSIASSPEVDDVLKARGALGVYSPDTADFSALSPEARVPGQELYVGSTAHRARIDVDEAGTEAAAATAVGFAVGGARRQDAPTLLFTVDRPFLYFIVERSTGAPLFSGHVVDPR